MINLPYSQCLPSAEVVRAVVGAMPAETGHRTTFAVDGQEAIDKYRAARERGAPYDIVITDLTIPGGLGGQEAGQAILQTDPQAKLIVSSGYATGPVMAHYAAYGFWAGIKKPCQFTKLRKIIQHVLST